MRSMREGIGGHDRAGDRCPGCGITLPACDGPTHAYHGASPACWARYGDALARAYASPVCRDVLQLVVDAYACQHPGRPGRRQAQSVWIHLMTLAMVLEDDADPREGPQLHRRMVARPTFTWLEPPADLGTLTVAALVDAPSDGAYVEQAWAWAWSVWRAWSPHRATVRASIARSLG